ncbi:MAG: sigma-70 family RNA polymerase sigma factor [Oscillospiraceae bacterium]|nr:sigma-70 family RNA polymerase sigma factor [Oscillospiraceae bacterium]MBR4656874.1 sigma-70 family RNA polymerase sigma factor [Oscillospiraceae bacterium]
MMDEKSIIEQVLAGDNNAFGQLVQEYQTKVYNLALRMCGSQDDAFDLSQEAFFRAWRNLPGFQFDSSFSTWLFRLTVNICLDWLRAKKRRPTVSLTTINDEDEELQLDVPDPGMSPEELLLAAEDRAELTRALNELPVEYREILTLRAINDMSYTEIAEVLKLREGTVKSRLSRARNALRNKLLQNGNKLKTETSIPSERRDVR